MSLPFEVDVNLSETWAEISADAILNNVRAIRTLVDRNTQIMAVLKADAYGHGVKAFADVAIKGYCTTFGIATVIEARELRELYPATPILIMSPILPEEASECIGLNLEPFISDIAQLEAIIADKSVLGTPSLVHLEIDTGMGRSGCLPKDAGALVKSCIDHGVKIRGICTHFPNAEEDIDGTTHQLKQFAAIVDSLKKTIPYPVVVHAANSAATLNIPGSHLDMVRSGLLIYGIMPCVVDAARREMFTSALSLFSRITLVRDLPKGTPISYGGEHTLARPSRVATISAGYGHGYPRALGNCGHVLIKGKRAPILGRICMDVTMADVTDIPEAEAGSRVTLIGIDCGESITVDELARLADTTPHAITTQLTPRVKRIYK